MAWNKKKVKLITDIVFGVLFIVAGVVIFYHRDYPKRLGIMLIYFGVLAFVFLIKKMWLRIALTICVLVPTILLLIKMQSIYGFTP
jgi:hypothetical protein